MTVRLKIGRRRLKEDHGAYDVGPCPLFTSDVDALGASNPYRMDEK